jgi:hypothetical protein
MAISLPKFFKEKKNRLMEGALMFSPENSILSTIRILALVQHYADVINDVLRKECKNEEIGTPMLDCTRDIRVASTFAAQKLPTHTTTGSSTLQRPSKRQKEDPTDQPTPAVRLLFVPPPVNVHVGAVNDTVWNGLEFGTYIQRLGTTRILLIDLATILPASALRPLNQSGYLMVVEDDLIRFHQLRTNVTTIDDVYNEMESEDAQYLIDPANTWDALSCLYMDVHICSTITAADFFHKIGEEAEDSFPRISDIQIYPPSVRDPMRRVMEQVTKKELC